MSAVQFSAIADTRPSPKSALLAVVGARLSTGKIRFLLLTKGVHTTTELSWTEMCQSSSVHFSCVVSLSKMTYNVLSGTLNLTHSLIPLRCMDCTQRTNRQFLKFHFIFVAVTLSLNPPRGTCTLPYLTFGVGRLLHLPSAEAVSVRPNAQPRCNQKVTVIGCEAENRL